MEEVLAYFRSQPYAISSSHPINPIRIKALQLFSASKLYAMIAEEQRVTPDAQLQDAIEDLIQVLLSLYESEFDVHRAHFIATGGLIMAGSDDDVADEELTEIVEYLSSFTIFPKALLDELVQGGNWTDLFTRSVVEILQHSPSERYPMFEYLIGIALSDNRLRPQEVELLYDLGQNLFGFPPQEIAQMLGKLIQVRFTPRLFLSE